MESRANCHITQLEKRKSMHYASARSQFNSYESMIKGVTIQ